MRKFISFITAVSFLCNSLAIAQPVNYTQVTKQCRIIAEPNCKNTQSQLYIPEQYGTMKQSMNHRLLPIDSPKQPLVILVKDAHCNYEVQHNIAKILEILIRDYGIDLVAVEGAEGKLDLSVITSNEVSVADSKSKIEKILDVYVKKGYVTGPEYLNITKYKKLPFGIYGVENGELYVKNFIFFRETWKNNGETKYFINELHKIIEQLKEKIYSRELLAFDRKSTEYSENKISLTEWIRYLNFKGKSKKVKGRENYNLVLKIMNLEERIDLKKVEQERLQLIKTLEETLVKEDLKQLIAKSLLFRFGKISSLDYYLCLDQYINPFNLTYRNFNREIPIRRRVVKGNTEFPLRGDSEAPKGCNPMDKLDFMSNLKQYMHLVKLQSKINTDALFGEIDEVTERIKEKLIKNNIQTELNSISKRVNVLGQLFCLQLEREGLEYFKLNREYFKTESIIPFLKIYAGLNNITIAPELTDGVFLKKVDESVLSADRFYELAIQRDKVLIENTIQRMEDEKKNKAVIVAGGFHADGVKKLLGEKGVVCFEITPKIAKEEVDNPYLSIMLDEKIKYEKAVSFNESSLAVPDFLGETIRGLHLPRIGLSLSKDPKGELIGNWEPRVKEYPSESTPVLVLDLRGINSNEGEKKNNVRIGARKLTDEEKKKVTARIKEEIHDKFQGLEKNINDPEKREHIRKIISWLCWSLDKVYLLEDNEDVLGYSDGKIICVNKNLLESDVGMVALFHEAGNNYFASLGSVVRGNDMPLYKSRVHNYLRGVGKNRRAGREVSRLNEEEKGLQDLLFGELNNELTREIIRFRAKIHADKGDTKPDTGAMKDIGPALDEDTLNALKSKEAGWLERAKESAVEAYTFQINDLRGGVKQYTVHARIVYAGSEMPAGVNAWRIGTEKDESGEYLIVAIRGSPDTLKEFVNEILYHESREAFWISKGVTEREAHILASAEQSIAFSKDGRLTQYHDGMLLRLTTETLLSLVDEFNRGRGEHYKIVMKHLGKVAADYMKQYETVVSAIARLIVENRDRDHSGADGEMDKNGKKGRKNRIAALSENSNSVFDELFDKVHKLYLKGDTQEAFVNAVSFLRYIMEYPDDTVDITKCMPVIIDVMKKYSSEYKEEISDDLIELLEKFSVRGIQSSLSKELKDKFTEDLTARRITYQNFKNVSRLRIDGMEKFELTFKDKKKYKDRVIRIEWIEERQFFWVPDKIIFTAVNAPAPMLHRDGDNPLAHTDVASLTVPAPTQVGTGVEPVARTLTDLDGKPEEIVYPKKIYDENLSLVKLALEVDRQDILPGRIISGLRVINNRVFIGANHKRYYCGGYTGARAAVYIGNLGIVSRIRFGQTKSRRPITVDLMHIYCRGILLDSYVTVTREILLRLAAKYGEIEIPNLKMTAGDRPHTPHIAGYKVYQLKGYSEASVQFRFTAEGRAVFDIKGINGYPDIKKGAELTTRAKRLEERPRTQNQSETGSMVSLSLENIEPNARIVLSRRVFEVLSRTEIGSEYRAGVLFSTNKGIKGFFPPQELDINSSEIFRSKLSEWCSDEGIMPESLRLVFVFHIHSYPYYLRRMESHTPLSHVVVPTMEALHQWKKYTIMLSWALKEMGAVKCNEYEIKHLVIGKANEHLFYAGYRNRVRLKSIANSAEKRLDVEALLNSGEIRFLPVSIVEQEQDEPKIGEVPDFARKYVDLREDTQGMVKLTDEDREAKIKFFFSNRQFVRQVMLEKCRGFLHLFTVEELVHVGENGLMNAVMEYIPELGKFKPFARYKIMSEIFVYIRQMMRHYRTETSIEVLLMRDGEIDYDMTPVLEDKGPSPQDILIEEHTDGLQELCKHIRGEMARDAFMVYCGLWDGSMHTYRETGKILFDMYASDGRHAELQKANLKRKEFSEIYISLCIEKARMDILAGVYGAVRAKEILEKRKELKRKKAAERIELKKQWRKFVTDGLKKEDWQGLVFTPELKFQNGRPVGFFRIPEGPRFVFDREYCTREIYMELREVSERDNWVVFRFISDGSIIREVLMEFEGGKPKKKTYIPEYRKAEDVFLSARWVKWLSEGTKVKDLLSGRLPCRVRRYKNYPFRDYGVVNVAASGKRKITINIPDRYIDKIVEVRLDTGGTDWFMVKIFDTDKRVVSAHICRILENGDLSGFNVTWKHIKIKSKLTDKEKRNVRELLFEEVIGENTLHAPDIAKIHESLKKEADRLSRERKENGVRYDSGYHWQVLRKIEITELYMRKSAMARGKDTNVSCGTICESGHERSYNSLDEQLNRQFGELRKILEQSSAVSRKSSDKSSEANGELIEEEADRALVEYAKKFGIEITFEQLQEHRRQIRESDEALKSINIFFSIPEAGTELFWVGTDYAGGHFNRVGTRIHISLPIILKRGIDAGKAIAKHELGHIQGKGHHDEGMKIVRKIAVENMDRDHLGADGKYDFMGVNTGENFEREARLVFKRLVKYFQLDNACVDENVQINHNDHCIMTFDIGRFDRINTAFFRVGNIIIIDGVLKGKIPSGVSEKYSQHIIYIKELALIYRDPGFITYTISCIAGLLIKRDVVKNAVVLDAGTGCGILGFVALKLGARKVIGIEKTFMSKYIPNNCAVNNIENRQFEVIETDLEADPLIIQKMGEEANKISVVVANIGPKIFGLANEKVIELLGSLPLIKCFISGGYYYSDARALYLREINTTSERDELFVRANGMDVTREIKIGLPDKYIKTFVAEKQDRQSGNVLEDTLDNRRSPVRSLLVIPGVFLPLFVFIGALVFTEFGGWYKWRKEIWEYIRNEMIYIFPHLQEDTASLYVDERGVYSVMEQMMIAVLRRLGNGVILEIDDYLGVPKIRRQAYILRYLIRKYASKYAVPFYRVQYDPDNIYEYAKIAEEPEALHDINWIIYGGLLHVCIKKTIRKIMYSDKRLSPYMTTNIILPLFAINKNILLYGEPWTYIYRNEERIPELIAEKSNDQMITTGYEENLPGDIGFYFQLPVPSDACVVIRKDGKELRVLNAGGFYKFTLDFYTTPKVMAENAFNNSRSDHLDREFEVYDSGHSPLIGKWMPVSEISFVPDRNNDLSCSTGIITFKAVSMDDPKKEEIDIEIRAVRAPPSLFSGYRETGILAIDNAMETMTSAIPQRMHFLLENTYTEILSGNKHVPIANSGRDNTLNRSINELQLTGMSA